MNEADRETVLDSAIRDGAEQGWRVESRSRFQATLVWGSPIGSRLLRGGALGLALGKRERRVLMSVTEAGEVEQIAIR